MNEGIWIWPIEAIEVNTDPFMTYFYSKLDRKTKNKKKQKRDVKYKLGRPTYQINSTQTKVRGQ